MNKRHYEHTLPNIRGSLSNTYRYVAIPDMGFTYGKIEYYSDGKLVTTGEIKP